MALSARTSTDCDILIVGGGMAGASLGAGLAGPKRVVLIEGESRCGYHATGRSAAFWLESYGGPQVGQLSAASRAFLERPPADFSEAGFLRDRGAVHIARGEAPHLPAGVEAYPVDRPELERFVPGIRPEWTHGVVEPGCADIDVAALHAAYLGAFRRAGGTVLESALLVSANHTGGRWRAELANGDTITSTFLVNAAGAWADQVAASAGVAPLGLSPKRRTMVQLRVDLSGLRDLPLVIDSHERFYFKGEGDRSIWLSPHDESECEPCDAAPEEIDVALAIDRFQGVVDWKVEAVERRWAGLRTFAPDRLPVIGFDSGQPAFFWFAGQGGVGIQTAPAAAALGTALLLDDVAPAIATVDAGLFSPKRFD